MPPFPHPNLRSRSTADRVQHESIAALQTTTIKTGVGSVLIANMDMDIFYPSDVQSFMDRSKEKNNLIANTTGAPVYVCIAKDLQSGEKDGTLDLIKNASRKCRHRSRKKTYVATVAIKLLNGLRSLPLTLEKDGRTTEDLERERSFVVVEIHDKSDRRVAKSSTDVRRENNHTRTKTGTFINCRRHPLKTTFNSNYGNKLDNDDRIKANQSRISEFFSLLERNGATGTLSLDGTELTIIYFLGIYKKCKCFWFIFLF